MSGDLYDIIILGCGPAGLSAAINAAIRNKKVVVIGGEPCSPPMHKAPKIDNYPGLPGISGEELLQRFMAHAHEMAIEIIPAKAELTSSSDGVYTVFSGENMMSSRTIIIATGVPYKTILPREKEMLGKGLGYCATCDGPLYRGKEVIIIARHSEAEYEASFMAELCQQVYYLPLYKNVGILSDRIKLLQGKPLEIVGEEYVEGLLLSGGKVINAEGLFIIGTEAAPDRLIPGLEMEANHIKVNREQKTNLPGIYAAGDCTGKPYQVAKSVGEGQVAGLNASRYATR